MIPLALLAGLLLAGSGEAGVVGLYGGHARTVLNREAAFRDAVRHMTMLRLPVSATPGRTVARSQLSELEAANNHADVGERWTVPGTIDSVIHYVRRNSPPGSTIPITESSGRPGTRGYSRGVTFAWTAVSDVLAGRYLAVSVSAAGGGQTNVFAQAESIWLSARPSSERFPSATDRLVLRITQRGRAARTRSISRRQTVAHLIGSFNATQIVQPDGYNCPAYQQMPSFTYSFLGAGDRVLARVSYTINPGSVPSPCYPMTVVIAGRRRHALLGGTPMISVQRIFGIRTQS